MNLSTKLLTGISSERPTTFAELADILGKDVLGPHNRDDWREILDIIEAMETCELARIKRTQSIRVVSVQLTPLGAERAREALMGPNNLKEGALP